MDKPNPVFFYFVKLFLGGGAPPASETNFLDPLAPTHQSPCCLQCLGDCDVGTLIHANNSTTTHRWRIVETRGGAFPLVAVQFKAK